MRSTAKLRRLRSWSGVRRVRRGGRQHEALVVSCARVRSDPPQLCVCLWRVRRYGGVFHGIDAIANVPAALFFDEVLRANPECKCSALLLLLLHASSFDRGISTLLPPPLPVPLH